MFGPKGFVFVFFAVFFFALPPSLDTLAQYGPFVFVAVTSPTISSETINDPPTDPREEKLESLDREIGYLEDQIESYNNWIQDALEDNDNIGQQIHNMDSSSEHFQEIIQDLGNGINSNHERIARYGEYINDSREKIAELTDKRYNLKKDIDENPFHPKTVPVATPDPTPQTPSTPTNN